VIHTETHTRWIPNCISEPFLMDTDYFTGQMVLFVKQEEPPPRHDTPHTDREYVRHYLSSKQRRFEFQFQIQLKRIPQGRVYFACELQESLKLGYIQRAFVNAATNHNFHYQLTRSNRAKNAVEVPHMAFPVEEGMNRVIVTPPGGIPPVLGSVLEESESSIKLRKKGMAPIQWSYDTTYTFGLWSAYVDFMDWKCLNLPGLRPFALNHMIGRQPIVLSLYELVPTNEVNPEPPVMTNVI
jgi:Protein of unknown function (DUF1769)